VVAAGEALLAQSVKRRLIEITPREAEVLGLAEVADSGVSRKSAPAASRRRTA
jgi:hypothetical protein